MDRYNPLKRAETGSAASPSTIENVCKRFYSETIFSCVYRTVYISLTSKAPRTVRLLHNSLPPELGLQPGHNFHLFLSHTWSSGQDQVATIKRQLQ